MFEDVLDIAEIVDPQMTHSGTDNWKTAVLVGIQEIDGIEPYWAAWIGRTQELALAIAMGEVNHQEIEAAYAELVSLLTRGDEPGTPVQRRPRNSRNRGPTNRRRGQGRENRAPNRTERRRYTFARCQDLFENEPKKLAEIVVANDKSLIENHRPPETQPIKDLYNGLWGVAGSTTSPTQTRMAEVYTPISALEVLNKIKKIETDSAAGPDLIKKATLKRH